jgi:hypothetical protein
MYGQGKVGDDGVRENGDAEEGGKRVLSSWRWADLARKKGFLQGREGIIKKETF